MANAPIGYSGFADINLAVSTSRNGGSADISASARCCTDGEDSLARAALADENRSAGAVRRTAQSSIAAP